jgi:uncharacterized repeat protein (TIGR04138 family)
MRADQFDEILQKDPRYPPEAYEFIFDALNYVQVRQQRQSRQPPSEGPRHVSARDLVEGARDLALEEFGFLAPTVFRLWNLTDTSDIGEVVYNLIAVGQMSQSPDDRREDFNGLFDLEASLRGGFAMHVEEE